AGKLPRKLFGVYSISDAKDLAANLDRDLQKVFKYQNLWRVAGGVGSDSTLGADHGLRFDVVRLKNEDDRTGEVLRSPTVMAGQLLGFQVENTGPEPLWLTILFCDANFGIDVY